MKRKIFALVLTLVMVIGMSTTVFATTTKTVTVRIENPAYAEAIYNQQSTEGITQYWFNDSVTVNENASLYTSLISNPSTVENYGTATAMDAIIQAINDSTLTDKTVNCNRVQYMQWDEASGAYVYINRYGIAFDRLSSQSHVSTYNSSTGETTYKYWQTNYNGNVTSDYATAYVLSDNDVIEVKWDVYVY